MKLHIIDTGKFKLDGGAMFGVVPKSLWSRTNPADENNLCTWSMRCLLIEDGDQLILIDNGIGNKQDAKFFSHYYLHGEGSLDGSLEKAGFHRNDITDMFLTHLHFDHCGGGVDYVGENKEQLELHFPNAKYWSNQEHWVWATQPNAREKASFLKENILPMQESGHLHFVPNNGKSPFSQFDMITADGHTDKQMLPKIKYKEHTIVFMADLLPSVGHIPLPYVMGYDTRPLLTLKEKEEFLNEAADHNYVLFLEHDSVNECCTVKHTEKGVRLDRTFPLKEIL
ncbi:MULTISPECIES: MBL fold metallo-hydrolase [Roseivirga]|jgi:glyoxylase-like metal-dependent hydrolase (beta-lactamase superfamily II)|uniref:MBL fold metallo-hydrolase n=1 Tax=Roseivirga TaxID=290180 RepID=UPI001B0DABE5|nr:MULTISPECIES: MBL fold metallo-hydrolase [Roseivirga]MBO6496794.1 MBL fold metallo-hydrolase [Roseivirga sp.]MBO6659968.1 MBL fold metallo-hydrolase [Roseivirga sp.]MBO6761648.1 MBL fold metallo-hydrolase [Roseivirga sp.]MBO6907295.1 MBL fold metallo-hydrolase [Roseivirga sp.]WPZ09670.1 MBL fold metallo-hydrolase [Roseivirga spongicola]